MRRALPALLALLLCAPASAFELVDDNQVHAQLVTWARAGWRLDVDDQGGLDQRPYLDLVRLLLNAEYKGLGRAFLNFEGKTGTLELLDCFAEVDLGEHVALRVGRDRTNLSNSFLVIAPIIAFNERSLINQEGYLHTRALGAGGRLKTKLGGRDDHRVALDVNAWVRDDGSPGNTWVARVLYNLGGLELHAALQEHVHLPERVVDENRQVALAAFFVDRGWTARGEALAVLDPEPGTSPLAGVPFVVHTELLRAFDATAFDRAIQIEPGFRYDISVREVVVQRATAGVNVYLLGHQLKTQLNYDVRVEGVDLSHTVSASLQGGL